MIFKFLVKFPHPDFSLKKFGLLICSILQIVFYRQVLMNGAW